MEAIEPAINLCAICRKQLNCIKKGIFQREICDQYEAQELEDWLEYDRIVHERIVGACPVCLGKNTYDCENNPFLQNVTIGHCLDCEKLGSFFNEGSYSCID